MNNSRAVNTVGDSKVKTMFVTAVLVFSVALTTNLVQKNQNIQKYAEEKELAAVPALAVNTRSFYLFKTGQGCVLTKNKFVSAQVCTNTPPPGICYETKEECDLAHSYYLFKAGQGCVLTKNKFITVDVCTNTPPVGTCYITKEECDAANGGTTSPTPTPSDPQSNVMIRNGDLGADLSSYDRTIDFSALKSKVKFAIIRSTYGLSVDSTFKTNWAGAKAVGLPRSAYHFFRCEDDVSTAAKLFASLTGQDNGNGTYTYKGDFMPFIDMEDEYTVQGCSKKTLTQRTVQFMDEFHRLTGVWPGLYSRANWYDSYLDSSLLPSDWAKKITEWNASWTNWGMSSVSHMREWRQAFPGGNGQNFFWQYTVLTSNFRQCGTGGSWLDMNRYVGSDLVFPVQ